MRIYTIGHSTRSLDEFIALLGDAGTTLLVDVRIAPGSRRHPQFAGATLPPALAGHGIEYLHLKGLGGRRRPRPDSPHQAWRVEGFRGYADHMETGAFQEALDVVIARARERTVTLMCAEAVPWRCHRRLIADALTVRGIEVVHLLGPDRAEPHHLPPFARIEGTRLIYDGGVMPLIAPQIGRATGAGIPDSRCRGRLRRF
jgi:uncharacterized protein (DUF488 family)